MPVTHLIKAHRILAAWQKDDPDPDAGNAGSLFCLSIAPIASSAELRARRAALLDIYQRQMESVQAAKAKLIASGVEDERLSEFETLVSRTATSRSYEILLDYLAMVAEDECLSRD